MIGSPPSPSSLSPCMSAPSACPQDMPPARQRTVCALATVRPPKSVVALETVRLIIPLLRLMVMVLASMPTKQGGLLTTMKMLTSSLRSPLAFCALLIVIRTAPDRETRGTTLAQTPNLLTRPRVAVRLQCGNCPWRSLVPASLYLLAPLAAPTLLLTSTSRTFLDLASAADSLMFCRLRPLFPVPRTA